MKLFIKIITILLTVNSASLSLYAEDLKIGYIHNGFQVASDVENGILWVIHSDSLIRIDLKTYSIEERYKFTFPSSADKVGFSQSDNEYIPVSVNKHLYIINESGGETYLWLNNDFVRIDISDTHNMQRGSTIFAFQGKIFRYGGYDGFSFCKNFFTFFNEVSKDWNVIHPETSDILPEGTINTITYVLNNNIYILFGKKFSVTGNLILEERVYVFEFNHMIWRKLGIIKDQLQPQYYVSKKDSLCLFTTHSVSILDFSKNRYKKFKFQINGFNLSTNPIYFNGVFYFLGNPIPCFNNETLLIIKAVPEQNICGDLIDSGKIYNSKKELLNVSYIGITILLFGVLILLIYNRIKKKPCRDKLFMTPNSITYKSRSIEIDDIQHKIICKLLKSDEVKTFELFDIIHKDHLHISQLSRILSSIIEEINLKLQLLTEIKLEFIYKMNSNIDNRMKVYNIVKEWFEF